MGYVYAVSLHGLVKVGRTDSIEQRLEQLRPAGFLVYLETDRDRNLEVELHQLFAAQRLPQSEWFKLDYRQIFYLGGVLASAGSGQLANSMISKNTSTLNAEKMKNQDLLLSLSPCHPSNENMSNAQLKTFNKLLVLHGIEVNYIASTRSYHITTLRLLPGVNKQHATDVGQMVKNGVNFDDHDELCELLNCPDELRECWKSLFRFNIKRVL